MCFYFVICSVINYMYHIYRRHHYHNSSLFIYKSIMCNATINVVRQPSGYTVLIFHWQYMSKFHLLFFLLIILYCL